MTELKLHTYGEKLIVSEKVTIASGDINSAAVAVEFDECWDNYPARTAIFKNDKVTGNIEVLMVDNKCTIPAEVLQKNGTLKISIRAVTADGTALKTSTKIRYTIAEGASPGTTTLTPTKDIYQQYLEAINGAFDPFSQQMKQLFNEFKEAMEGEVLWENPDDTVAFDAQTITLDLSEYKKVKIIFRNDLYTTEYTGIEDNQYIVVSGYMETDCSIKGIKYQLQCYGTGTNQKHFNRYYVFNDTGIVFEEGKCIEITIDGNKGCIPSKIIGFRY